MLSLIQAVVWVLLAVKNHQQPSLLNRLMVGYSSSKSNF